MMVLVTNYHSFGDGYDIPYILIKGQWYQCKKVCSGRSQDIMLMELVTAGKFPVELFDSSKEFVVEDGNWHRLGGSIREGITLEGKKRNSNRVGKREGNFIGIVSTDGRFVIDLRTTQGESGSLVVNNKSDTVVGMVCGNTSSYGQKVGYIIPASAIARLFEKCYGKSLYESRNEKPPKVVPPAKEPISDAIQELQLQIQQILVIVNNRQKYNDTKITAELKILSNSIDSLRDDVNKPMTFELVDKDGNVTVSVDKRLGETVRLQFNEK